MVDWQPTPEEIKRALMRARMMSLILWTFIIALVIIGTIVVGIRNLIETR